MIVIIADDLSGAAELAGIAAARGLRSEVHLTFDPASTADVIAIDTNTRPLRPVEAAARVGACFNQVAAIRPDWIYKKTDSVLRGNVRTELETIMAAGGWSRSLFIPANPGLKRIISNGCYFIDGQPLHETPFADDPAHPCVSPRVRDLLGGDPAQIHTPASPRPLKAAGIFLPDIDSAERVRQWATGTRGEYLAAGAAEFFTALLEARSVANVQSITSGFHEPAGPKLFVCGSLAAWQSGIERRCRERNVPLFVLPEPGADQTAWLAGVGRALEDRGTTLIALGQPRSPEKAAQLTRQLVGSARRLIEDQPIGSICIDGGATASALVEELTWHRLTVRPVRWRGVGCFRGSETGPHLFIKPGSYPWPDALLT